MPPILRSRYEQYKRDTQHFTTWLANTAISLGYPVAQFDKRDGVFEDVAPALSANAKKNARKKAKAKERKLGSAGPVKEDKLEDSPVQEARKSPLSPDFDSLLTIRRLLCLEVSSSRSIRRQALPVYRSRSICCRERRVHPYRRYQDTQTMCRFTTQISPPICGIGRPKERDPSILHRHPYQNHRFV
jgi:hypothetical protein